MRFDAERVGAVRLREGWAVFNLTIRRVERLRTIVDMQTVYLLNSFSQDLDPFSILKVLPMLSSARRKSIACFVAPLLCMGVLIMFVVVVCDFAAFRLKSQMTGPERPKGLWEF